MRKRTGILLVVFVVIGSLLAACSQKNGSSGVEQVFRMNITAEPPSLDPAQMQDQVSSTVMTGLFEGLTKLDDKGAVIPAIADKWEISDGGKKYTFHIRKDAKWSNGDPVTAHDFEYSWKRTLDPALTPPAPYAYQLYYIKNAQNYNIEKGNPKHITDPNMVGVKAIDDNTLEVDLENPTPYFLSLTSFYTYYPVHKSVKDNPAWASEAKTMISDGPFEMSSWKHNASIELVRNPYYYDKAQIKLDKVEFSMVKDANTELSMYQRGDLDWAGKPVGLIPTEQLAKFIADKNPELHVKGVASTYYYEFNNTKKPFDNVKVRKALAMAIDRKAIVEKVTKGGETPAYGFVPPGIHGVNGDYRSEVPDNYFKEDIPEAKKLLAEGLAEEGMKSMPPVTLTFNEGLHQQVAEAIADMWKTNLGFSVKTETQEWAVFLQNRTSLNYDIARAGWGADYNDPMTFIDLFTSTSGNNDTGFKDPQYDALVKEAYSTSDQKARVEAMSKAEKILIADDMVIMPIYYYTSDELIKPYVKNVLIDYKGDIDYTRAYIDKK